MKTFKLLHPKAKSKILIEEIIRIEGDVNYCHLILSTGRKIILARTLKAYEKALSLPFVRVSKSCMVNLKYLHKNPCLESQQLLMVDGTKIQISRRRIETVSQAILSVYNA